MKEDKTLGDPNWSAKRIELYLSDMFIIAPEVVFSEGWAWHLLSAPGHSELKSFHDHRDVRFYVSPSKMSSVDLDLGELGFVENTPKNEKSHEKAPKEDFHRYEKFVDSVGIKIIFEVIVRDVPFRTIGEYRVLEPTELLKLYEKSAVEWVTVAAARKLLAQGIDPQGRPELTTLEK